MRYDFLANEFAPLLTVGAFGAGAILFAFEGRLLPEGLWIASTYGWFAASTFFGIVAWRQGKRPLILAALSASVRFVIKYAGNCHSKKSAPENVLTA